MTRFEIYMERIHDGDLMAATEAANDVGITKAESYVLYREARKVAKMWGE